jgi:hypothetical protein
MQDYESTFVINAVCRRLLLEYTSTASATKPS